MKRPKDEETGDRWRERQCAFKFCSFIRNWWYTYPPRSLNCRIWVKSLREKKQYEKVRSKTIILQSKRSTARSKTIILQSKTKFYNQNLKNEYSAVNFFATSYSRGNFFVTLSQNEGMAFLRSTLSSIARDCERELKTASQGTLGGLTMFH